MGILDILLEKNESPVLFIGSGIPKRYLQDFPSWDQLLKQLWVKIGKEEEDYYRQLLLKKEKIGGTTQDPNIQKFIINTEIASEIKHLFDKNFYEGNIQLDNFSSKESYETNISPFKKQVSLYFKDLVLKDDVAQEVELFKELLLKSRAIITTNYDRLIENLVGPELKVFTRQTDLFLSEIDCGELYKVHGCIISPEEIVLTKEDYERFDKNSALISAKLTSFLMESPIIFLGYSISDQNISKIMKRFTQSLYPKQKALLQERIIYVDYKTNQKEIKEYRVDSSALGTQFTVLETDNYSEIYKKLSGIDQGVPISYLRRFKQHIRTLIIERGKQGMLKSLLLTPCDLDDNEIKDSQTVIAIGNNTVIFNIPNRFEYLRDYMEDVSNISTTVALKFIASQNINTRIPIEKHIANVKLDECYLRPDEIEKIKQRLNKEQMNDCINSINQSHRKVYNSIAEIKALKERKQKEIDLIAYNFSRLDTNEIKEYIINTFNTIQYNEWKSCMTQLSRLTVIWDFNKK